MRSRLLDATLGRALTALVLIYRYAISPLLPPRCRHVPSCSEYCLEALRTHGALSGTWLGLCRLLRCHPWGSHGHDPVPSARHTDGPAAQLRTSSKS